MCLIIVLLSLLGPAVESSSEGVNCTWMQRALLCDPFTRKKPNHFIDLQTPDSYLVLILLLSLPFQALFHYLHRQHLVRVGERYQAPKGFTTAMFPSVHVFKTKTCLIVRKVNACKWRWNVFTWLICYFRCRQMKRHDYSSVSSMKNTEKRRQQPNILLLGFLQSCVK